ncbi:ABC transporter substrate-binding protein [Baekduia sp.]|uniref:ABC transporter substrate-binding protein n=1 Tax=Baekduia sp. TaxID=2600305 RepID=UPI002E025018|nr:ABC transporter substrate-binding protein [Baekduia sp.]
MLLLLGACGKDDAGNQRPSADHGGTLTMLAASDVDFLDPGHTYYSLGIQVALATQRPLYGFRPDDLSQPVPDLASALPVISADGRTITVRIRRGVRFSPPVNREVVAHDVAYAFDRFFSVNVGGQYPGYFADLIGAPAKPTKGVHAISGITTPDARTIVFHLRKPSAAAFVGALTLPASAPVPEEYAKAFDAENPSTYNTHVVATGPYMVRNDRDGATVGYQAGRRIELVRNPNWDRATDRRPARLNRVIIQTNASDSNVAARQVLAGTHKVLDGIPPPPVLEDVAEHHRDQAVQLPMGGYRVLPINTTIKPFTNLNVRKAVVAGFDRQAARQARGGPITGPLATHFLPPGIPGFEEAGGLAGPGYDFLSVAHPRGDAALAATYMRRAGYPSGRYTGKEKFLVVAGNSPSEKLVAQVVQSQFEKLGFRIRLRYVPSDALFTDWCAVPSRKLLTCGSGLAWLKDFPDPQPMLQPVFDGHAIAPTSNTNYSQLNDPAINAAMAKAVYLRGAARRQAWAQIDRMIVAQAPGVPLQWDVSTLIHSKDVAGVPNVYFDSWDLSYTSLK